MNTHNKSFRIKLAAGLAMGISCLLYAAAVFIPSTQPTVLLGQYALQSTDLLNSNTIAYRPWFENGAWQGDIIEYLINQDGSRSTDVSVGANPATQGASGGCGRPETGCWSARASFIDNDADNPTGTYWQSRNIFTYNSAAVDDALNPNGQVAFTWDLLSETQRARIDPATYNYIVAAADPTLNTATASDILNYVRGERLHEKINDTETGSLGDLRTRYSVLGDITGTPVYIGPPRELLRNVDGFTTFLADQAERPGRIAFGANDGMLHVLNDYDGSEAYAYVPSMVLGKLGKLAARYESYRHTYYVDGELTTGSVQIGSSTPVWHTILSGGGGAGFPGLFALDVTGENYSEDKLLFEKTGGNWGHVYGRPRHGFIGASNADPTWHIFTGNGYSTSSLHPTLLMMVNLDDNSVTEIDTHSSNHGGLSAPVLLSTDDDDQTEVVFAGDINGDLWMFQIDQTTPSSSTALKIFDGDPDQPISNAPAIAKHPTEEGYMVYIGTGSIFSAADALNDGLASGGDPVDQADYTDIQSVYGIWIDTTNLDTLISGNHFPITSGDLQSQTLAETSKVFIEGQPAEDVRYIPSANEVYYRCPFGIDPCPTLHLGWKIDLPNCGERLVGSPFVRAGRIQFVTTNPTGPTPFCGERSMTGDSWVMSLDYMQGSDNNKIVYNLNGDSELNNGDAITISDVYKAPVGLSLGPGNIAQPTFARLKAGVDKMFINGIQLPVAPLDDPADILAGHIDVVVDSPDNTGASPEIAPNGIYKHSEGYSIRTNDGLGRAVDGHVHDYDGIHGVDYVDLFTLEPRRGQSNLVTSLGITSSGSTGEVTCSTADNTTEVLVSDGSTDACIPAVEGELNRVYDTLHQDRDGNLEPLNGTDDAGAPEAILQSEVNSLNEPGADPFTQEVPEKDFIITLANADRSISGTIQIGCRTWPVVAYQNLVTTQLRDGRTEVGSLVDQNGVSLVLTLDDIMAEDPSYCPGGENSGIGREQAIAAGLSPVPTIRVGFGARSILDGGIHATRSQCVLGLHDPRDTVCFSDEAVLTAANLALATSTPDPSYSYSSCVNFNINNPPPADYIRDPNRQLHITESARSEGGGFRWRNGALTVQLLDAGIDPSADLQPAATMVAGSGAHAKAYTLARVGPDIVPVATEAEESSSPDESGMLYEAAIFWHYSALVDDLRNSDPDSSSTPKDAACYGGDSYSGQTTIDEGGLTLGEYQALTDPLVAECEELTAIDPEAVCDLNRFFQLLELIDSAESESDLNQALLELAQLLDGNDALQAYADKRDYIGDKIPEQNKLEGDKTQGDDGLQYDPGDGTPAQVTTIETIDLEARGPNFVFGRRNWIDIKQ
ncbi:MAG: PilC/PilY family type IV pilus protein [Gammaproteobacteria bacterium]|nr:PilC/PilY family type IV pilus protein [Gammaproteobacteria bacterium]